MCNNFSQINSGNSPRELLNKITTVTLETNFARPVKETRRCYWSWVLPLNSLLTGSFPETHEAPGAKIRGWFWTFTKVTLCGQMQSFRSHGGGVKQRTKNSDIEDYVRNGVIKITFRHPTEGLNFFPPRRLIVDVHVGVPVFLFFFFLLLFFLSKAPNNSAIVAKSVGTGTHPEKAVDPVCF